MRAARPGCRRHWGRRVEVDQSVRDLIAEAGLGDARRAYTILERALVLARAKGLGVLDKATVEEAAQRKLVLYDKSADAHYDVISAFIKSLRGSDPDAALYYLAVMLDRRRRPEVHSASHGHLRVRGRRQCRPQGPGGGRGGLASGGVRRTAGVSHQPGTGRHLPGLRSQVQRLVCWGRGRSWRGQEHGALAPPLFLRSTGYSGAKEFGHGVGYEYPHDSGGYVGQSYLPEELQGREFYRPTGEGHEDTIRKFLEKMRALRREDAKEPHN